MNNMMTNETPTKVMSLLGASLVSLALLFSVTLSNASFSGVENPIPDTFGPQNVVAVVDTMSNVYSDFLNTNVFEPMVQSYASLGSSAQEGLAYIIDNSDSQIVAMTGLSGLVQLPPTPIAHAAPGSVAGAYISHVIAQ